MKIPGYIKEEIINRYRSYPYSLQEMSEMYPYCSETIRRILKAQNVDMHTKQQIHNRDAIEDYFSLIRSEEQAYLLGLLIADGCVFYDTKGGSKCPRIALSLQEQDRYMVEYFANAINSPNQVLRQVKHRSDAGEEYSVCYQASIYSYIMANDLDNYGMCVGKMFRELPLLPYTLIPHLLRGYFDGDGSFSYGLTHPERKVCNSQRGCIDIVAWPNVMDDLTWIYTNLIGVSSFSFNNQKNTPWLRSIRLRRKDDIVRFYNYIYTNATIFLHGKKTRFESFFREENMIV